MSEIVNNKTVFSLLEVSSSIQKTLGERYKASFWVTAEMSKLNLYAYSGHCYPELVQKQGGKVIAQMKSVLWRDDYLHINSTFLRVLREPLKDGIKILFQAKITFDPVHGLSLVILDIDPGYTLGDLEREKQETIKKLRDEGLFNENKSRSFALLPQRIAIISVETSKGYADFIQIIETNPWNYKFFHFLFPSLLQGENAIPQIIGQLKRIKKVISHFDVVAIIRGGGGDIGLSCFNDYTLSKEIALFPIPVITGIGHATNETVVEMIAFTNAITPSKIAEYLIQQFHNFAFPVQKARDVVSEKAKRIISDEKNKLKSHLKLFRSLTHNVIIHHKNDIKTQKESIIQHSGFFIKTEKSQCLRLIQSLKTGSSGRFKTGRLEIAGTERILSTMSPANVLKRGYSITFLNGRSVRDFDLVKPGDEINTTLLNGQIVSIVKSSEKNMQDE